MAIDLVDESDCKVGSRLNKNGEERKIFSERVCCYPQHQGDRHHTWTDPNSGVVVWRRVKINGKWDGKSYYCESCYQKSNKAFRKGELDNNHNMIKGGRVENALEEAFGFRNCNKEKDDYNYPFDLYDPVNKLKVQVRSTERKIFEKKEWKDKKTGKSWGPYKYSGWYISLDFDRDNCGVLYAVCMSKGYEYIEKIYKILEERLPASLGVYFYDENIDSHKKIDSQYKDCLLGKMELERINKIYKKFVDN